MKKVSCEIIKNTALTRDIYEMTLYGDVSAVTSPGQFVEIAIPGLYLRRPISVCDFDPEKGELVIIYKVVGAGTDELSRMERGSLDMITGLGNGYDTSASGGSPLLIGGGVGIPPLYGCAKRLLEGGVSPHVILGYNSAEDIYYADSFRALGVTVELATVDGSAGTHGFVTDIMPDSGYTYFYSCGPLPMLRAVSERSVTSGEFSLEARMGCGFGACMGCSIMTANGARRVCREGPVFKKEEIIW